MSNEQEEAFTFEKYATDTIPFEVVDTEHGQRSVFRMPIVLPLVEEEPEEEVEDAEGKVVEAAAENEITEETEAPEDAEQAEGEGEDVPEEEEEEPDPYEAHRQTANATLTKFSFIRTDTHEGEIWRKTKHDTRNTQPYEYIKLEFEGEELVMSGWVRLNDLTPEMPELQLAGYAALIPRKDARNTCANILNAINETSAQIFEENKAKLAAQAEAEAKEAEAEEAPAEE